jgi:hypothetical protein
MTIEQDAQERDTVFGEKLRFTEKVRERIHVWINAAGDAPVFFFMRLRRLAAGITKSTWIAFAIVAAGNIIAFNYYQERITRYYLGILLMNIVSLNEDIDSLQAKINQLNKKIDDIDAKVEKPAQSSPSAASAAPSSSLVKHRSR